MFDKLTWRPNLDARSGYIRGFSARAWLCSSCADRVREVTGINSPHRSGRMDGAWVDEEDTQEPTSDSGSVQGFNVKDKGYEPVDRGTCPRCEVDLAEVEGGHEFWFSVVLDGWT